VNESMDSEDDVRMRSRSMDSGGSARKHKPSYSRVDLCEVHYLVIMCPAVCPLIVDLTNASSMMPTPLFRWTRRPWRVSCVFSSDTFGVLLR
jgi:hypothetical protein